MSNYKTWNLKSSISWDVKVLDSKLEGGKHLKQEFFGVSLDNFARVSSIQASILTVKERVQNTKGNQNITAWKNQLMNGSGTEGYVSPDCHLDDSLLQGLLEN